MIGSIRNMQNPKAKPTGLEVRSLRVQASRVINFKLWCLKNFKYQVIDLGDFPHLICALPRHTIASCISSPVASATVYTPPILSLVYYRLSVRSQIQSKASFLAMSSSPESAPNPPETDLSFSSMSQIESQVNPSDDGQCPHIKAALAEEATRTEILSKYKAVVLWTVNRAQDVLHPAKRRKVSAC